MNIIVTRRIFLDFNNDSLLDRKDLSELIRRITNPEMLKGLEQDEIDRIVNFVSTNVVLSTSRIEFRLYLVDYGRS